MDSKLACPRIILNIFQNAMSVDGYRLVRGFILLIPHCKKSTFSFAYKSNRIVVMSRRVPASALFYVEIVRTTVSTA